ncbi:MAG TPA: glycosyltransferase family 4 protein [Patescibacteria group bacterium]|nr:glycosyltransferase family 4 protein [Patescibacteria group bacterium]
MRILVVTQVVDADSSTLGFFIEWLREFARQCEEVRVIGLAVGRHDLPANVRVMSMGKEKGAGKFARLFAFWKHLRTALPDVDGVFIHMCPEYLIAGWPLIAASGKPTMLWYAHRQSNWKVRLGARMAGVVGTISEGSFPFPTPKARVMGHGIPTERFAPAAAAPVPGRLVAVGRISAIKRLELLIDAVGILRRAGRDVRLELWGEPIMAGDRSYKEGLVRRVEEQGLSSAVSFRGSAAYGKMAEAVAAASVALNAAPDGALDKAVLEAMACARPIVATNRNFAPLLGVDADRCLAESDPADVAAKIGAHLDRPDPALGARLRAVVEREHSLKRLITRILSAYERPRP